MLVDFVKHIHTTGREKARTKHTTISEVVFWAVLVLFVGEALAVALTASYPLPIDESYHFGLIQFFSHQWLPFVHTQPAGTYQFGDITHYDSYLYHYLMSFPLRIIELFTQSQQTQVILLRVLSIGMFVGAFVLLRRILRDMRVSQWAINVALLIYVLLPMVPFWAAHVNYDSLFTLTLVVFVRLGQRVITSRQAVVRRRLIALFLSVGLLGCLVKYSFVPVAFVGIVTVGVCLWRHRRSISRRQVKNYDMHEKLLLAGVGLLLLVSGGLFVQRYGVNLMTYHAIEPDCARLHTVAECQEYGAWSRNYSLKEVAAQAPQVTHNPLKYLKDFWLPINLRTIGGTYSSTGGTPPLATAMKLALLLLVGGIVAVLVLSVRGVVRDRALLFIVGITVAYGAALFINNFSQFEAFRSVVAVQGRYMLPFLPALLAVAIWQVYTTAAMSVRAVRARLRKVEGEVPSLLLEDAEI